MSLICLALLRVGPVSRHDGGTLARGHGDMLGQDVPRYGPGQHPRSRAALEANRFPLVAGMGRRCASCGRPALRGQRGCLAHNGRVGAGRVTPGRIASRTLAGLERVGLLPGALMALPTWRDMTTCPVELRAPLRLALVRAWDTRDTCPLVWAALWREANVLARSAPPPAPWRKGGVPLWMLAR